MKFIKGIMDGIEKMQTAFRFVRALEKGLIAFKAEFEKGVENQKTIEQ